MRPKHYPFHIGDSAVNEFMGDGALGEEDAAVAEVNRFSDVLLNQ